MVTYSSLLRGAVLTALVVSSTACSGAQERKASYLQKGQAYYNDQNYDKARIELRNALQIDPKYVEARYLSGQIAEKRGEMREALLSYQAAVDENPKYSEARAALARMYLLGGVPDKASELVEAGLKDDPQHPALLTVKAAVDSQAGRLVPALETAEAAYKQTPDNEFTVVLLASLYKQNGQVDKAVEIVTQGTQKLPKSVDLHIVLADLEAGRNNYDQVQKQLEQIIALEPKKLEHRTQLAQFFLFRKDIDKAEATVRQAIKDLPDQPDTKLALIDFMWAQRGEAAAIQEIQTMVAHEPDNAELKLSLGSYLERQGKVDQAEQTFQEIIKKSGTEAAGLSARNRLAALYLLRHNDSAKASALVAEVLKENARDNDALILRANMALQKGDAATAITDLRGVLRDQPNSAPLMRALAKAHLQNNEASLAEETLRSALQANPGDMPTRKELAQLLVQQGKADQARTLLDQLAKAQGGSTDLEILDNQFKAQLMGKDYEAAKQTAEKRQQLRPKEAVGWYFAGLVAEGQRDMAAARKQYELALEKQPDGAEPLVALVKMDVADKQIGKAMQRIDKAIAGSPKNAVAYNLRGELLLVDKKWTEAEAAFNKSAEVAPEWWAPYRGLAQTWLAQKKVDQAINIYQTGISKAQKDTGILSTELASLYEGLGKPDESIKVYEQWLQREPKSMVAANNLVMLLLNYRNDKASLDRSVKLAEGLVSATDPALLDTRGWVKYRVGDYPGAVNLLQQASKAAPGNRTMSYHLGMAQWKAGNVAEAKLNLQAAVKDNVPFVGNEEARKALAAIGTK
jgi:tetratricopeptide (TPR) repeat protein